MNVRTLAASLILIAAPALTMAQGSTQAPAQGARAAQAAPAKPAQAKKAAAKQKTKARKRVARKAAPKAAAKGWSPRHRAGRPLARGLPVSGDYLDANPMQPRSADLQAAGAGGGLLRKRQGEHAVLETRTGPLLVDVGGEREAA